MGDVQRLGQTANYATMESALILLASGPDNAFRAFAGEEEAAYRDAFGAFVAAWGPETVWFDPEARVIGSDGGVTLGRWRAHLAARPPSFALIVTVAGTPADVYLVDGSPTAERILSELRPTRSHSPWSSSRPFSRQPGVGRTATPRPTCARSA